MYNKRPQLNNNGLINPINPHSTVPKLQILHKKYGLKFAPQSVLFCGSSDTKTDSDINNKLKVRLLLL